MSAFYKIPIETVGSAAGIVLPPDLLEALHVYQGDVLLLSETPDGFKLSRYQPEVAAQLDIAADIMAEDKAVLRELAK